MVRHLRHLRHFPRCGDVKSWQYIIIQIYHEPGCKILNHINLYQKTVFFDHRILKKYHFYPYFCIKNILNRRKWRKWRIYICMWKKFYKKSKEQNGKTKKYLYMIYMVRRLRHLRHFCTKNILKWRKSGTEKIFYIYIYIYINLPKLGFYGLDTVPFRPCIFTDFLKLYIFCTKMAVLSVLSYIYTYGRKKIKKSMEQKKKKFFIYINTNHTTFPTFPPF